MEIFVEAIKRVSLQIPTLIYIANKIPHELIYMLSLLLFFFSKMDRAVQVLLEGEPTDASYYPDALRYV